MNDAARVAISPDLEDMMRSALVHHQQGRHSEAEAGYRQVLDAQPRHADALYLLGRIALDQGAFAQAEQLFARAIDCDPLHAAYHHNLGEALRGQGRWTQAVDAYQHAVRLKPEYATAMVHWAQALIAQNRLYDAEAVLRRSVQTQPTLAEAHNALGDVLRLQGQIAPAIEAYREAVSLRSDFVLARMNLGHTLSLAGRTGDALAEFEKIRAAQPDNVWAQFNVGVVRDELGDYEQAIDAYRRAIALDPTAAAAHYNLGAALQRQGCLDESLVCFRTATGLAPDNPRMGSNPLYLLNFLERDTAAIFAEHRAWGQRHADPLTALAAPHANDRTPQRRLRIGYVSAHFRQHAVNFFVEPILAAHDHDRFEVVCYSSVAPNACDATTQRLQGYADMWRDISDKNDEQASQIIRDDRIDLLVDLAGHIGGSRLLLFARKPAPIQVTYIGYQNTTGMAAMDYRLTDAWSDPPGLTDAYYTEKLVRLPRTFFCYLPSADAPDVAPPPVQRNGFITFGSFNNFAKVTPQVLATWAEILQAVPESRLLIVARVTSSLRDRVISFFAQHGVDARRIELCTWRPRREFLELINQVDIGLDAFPFVGHTTTCDALWQGVPVVTIAGKSYASRFGSSALVTLGLQDGIADSPARYVAIAARMAQDGAGLCELRAGLRETMRDSPLLDARRFVADLEASYRRMWTDWCAAAAKPTMNV